MVNGEAMIRTGVRATESEIEQMGTMLNRAERTPVITFGGPDAQDWASRAWDEMHRAVHDFALAHGLPEIQGYYGCDLKTGEFVLADEE